jgi:tRNA-dihydrouridine synthase
MTHLESLLKRNKRSLERISIKDTTPVQIQILSSNEKKLDRYLSSFKLFKGFKGFNLNLSCPSRNVIKQGKGAAMVKRAKKTQKLVSTIRDYDFPVSIKIRLGLNQFEKDNKLYLNNLGGVDPDFFIVHSKHAGQTSRESEDDSVYEECVQAARGIPVIANGGIDSSNKVNMLKDQGLNGVMIGRPALNNPVIFNTIKNELGINSPPKPVPGISALKEEYQSIHKEHSGNNKYLSAYSRILKKSLISA